MTDFDADQGQELERFANVEGQPNQPMRGHALVQPTRSITPIGAQPVARMRDEPTVMRKLTELGAMAGDDWFYRFPVRNKDGSQDWIEGPSIKCANNVARLFGNNITEVREIDVGDAWTFYARFTDLETGYSTERAYRQRKAQITMKTKDPQRALDIVYQIGQSKAIRNVIVNALQMFADRAFQSAQHSLVEKIGKDIEAWRKRTVDGIANMHCELKRVERVLSRSAKDWLAPDIARVIAMMRAVADGMATLDETFPPDQQVLARDAATSQSAASEASGGEAAAHGPHVADAPPSNSVLDRGVATAVEERASPARSAEPVRAGASEQAAPPAANTAPQPTAAAETTAAAPADPPHPTPPAGPSPSPAPRNRVEYLEMLRARCAASTDPEHLRAWFVSDQQRKIRNGAGMIASETKEARDIVEQRCRELGL